MGHRLSKIYTRTGDEGTTGMADGSRVDKNTTRIRTIGEVDELNACIGLLLSEEITEIITATLTNVQNSLFDLGAELAVPGTVIISKEDVMELENSLDDLNRDLEPLKEFILPGGSRAAATCHLARTICRRAEREFVGLSKEEETSPSSLMYLNRLSDYLFVAARTLNKYAGNPDVLWESKPKI